MTSQRYQTSVGWLHAGSEMPEIVEKVPRCNGNAYKKITDGCPAGNVMRTARITWCGPHNAHWHCRIPFCRHRRGLVKLEMFKLPLNKSFQVKGPYREVGLFQWPRHMWLRWNTDEGTSVGLLASGGVIHHERPHQSHRLGPIICLTLEKPMTAMEGQEKNCFVYNFQSPVLEVYVQNTSNLCHVLTRQFMQP